MDNPILSIGIVSLRTRELLRDCLRSIQANPPGCPYEIIVVDNASDDGTVDMLQGEFPEVHVIQNTENLGYTHPMNQALLQARGCYLMQLNPDTLILPGALGRLLDFMEAHPEVGICTPKVLNRDGTLQKQCRRSAARPWDVFTYFTGLAHLFPHSKVFGGYLQTYWDEDQIHPVEAVSGSCNLARRKVYETVGYLDERFFAYQEDSDFCFRARQAGWQIYYVPLAKVIHYGGQGGSRAQPYRAVYEWHRSYFLYYRKNLAHDYFFLINGLFYLAMSLKLGLTLLLTFFRRDKYAGSRKP